MIDAPMKAVYQTLINVDKRPEWLDGVDTIDREMTSERINMRHNCVFHGSKADQHGNLFRFLGETGALL